jgi:uncharacterized integral membrane protein
MKKQISAILISVILGIWMGAIAILSVQNATPVQLSFLGLQSIQMPVGVVLAFAVAIGTITGAIFSGTHSRFPSGTHSRSRR